MKTLQIMYGNSCRQACVMKANFSENSQYVTPIFPLIMTFRVSICSELVVSYMLMRQNVNNDVTKDSLIVSSSDSFYSIVFSLYCYFYIIAFSPYNGYRWYYPVVKGKQTLDGRSYKTSVTGVPRPLFKIKLEFKAFSLNLS